MGVTRRSTILIAVAPHQRAAVDHADTALTQAWACADACAMFELLGGFQVNKLLWPLAVACPRIFGFWLAFPLFGQKAVPATIRNGVTVAVALFAWPLVASRMPHPMPQTYEWLLLLPKELAIGFCIGFSLGVVVWALESAGTLIDTQSGTNNAAQMDPNAGAPLGPTGVLLRQYALALVLTSGMLVQYVVALVQSFAIWPWHGLWPDTQLLGQAFFSQRTDLFWQLTLRFVAPVMLALLLTEIGLGLVNRSTQQFDVYRIGMPVKNLLAAAALAITAGFWAEALVNLYREDAQRLVVILRAAAR
jgi:type III secretion protein T